MAAITTIRNGSDKNEILVFHQTPFSSLALRQDEDKTAAADTNARGFKEISTPEGLATEDAAKKFRDAPPARSNGSLLRSHTSLASIRNNNLDRVYAIDWNGLIAQVSPVYEVVRPQTVAATGGIAAATDGGDNGWIYYLSSSDNTPRIAELVLQFGTAAVIQGVATPNPATYLAAFYNPENGNRGVFYQGTQNGLRFLTIEDGSTPDTGINSTENALPGTPIAVSVVQHGDKQELHLYYISAQLTLFRVSRPAGGSWGSATIVRNAPPVSNYTQLSVTQNPSARINNVYYISRDNNQLIRFPDRF